MEVGPNKTWSGRFTEPVCDLVKRYTASVGFDNRLAEFDIKGSLAHAKMLCKVGVLSAEDLAKIEQGMAEIWSEIQQGVFIWSIELEDVHLNIERRLTEKIGDAGKRLHTARSRNDQIATDMRLYLREEIDNIISLIKSMQNELLEQAQIHAETVMPGLTHLQAAQPVTFGHHLMAYVEMLMRDTARFTDCRHRMNYLPLGSAALAGTSFPIDRVFVAKELGFDGVCENSLDAVSDRDFVIEFTLATSVAMMHLSRLSEEIILWMSPNLDFIDLADRFCTGSSIMPQKKNPDVPELVRGKTGRINGNLVALLTIMKGQPLAYNKDNQEDKEPLFDSIDTLKDTLRVYAEMIRGITVKADNMREAVKRGFMTATDFADYLVKKGVPFRDAHESVSLAVRYAEEKEVDLSELSLVELKSFSPFVEQDIFAVLGPEGSVLSRNHVGGTAPNQVHQAIIRAKEKIGL